MNIACRLLLAVASTALAGSSKAVAQYDGESDRNRARVLMVSNWDETERAASDRAGGTQTGRVTSQQPARDASRTSGAFPALVPPPTSHESDQSSAVLEKNAIAGPAVTVTSSLAVVLGLFAGLVWLTRRFGNRSLNQKSLPEDVMQSLGSASLDTRTKVTMLRCGSRIVILAQNAGGVYPISEVTDPDEVRQLIASCAGDSKRSFAQTLQAFEQQPAPPGFVDHDNSAADHRSARRRGRLFATA